MDSGVKTLIPSTASPKHKNPWGTPSLTPSPCSLSAVMDEELARKLQTEEEEGVASEGCGPDHTAVLAPPTSETGDDFLLAQMLQLEFDREHDLLLTAEEKQYNRDSKVRVSFEKYRSLPSSYLDDEEEEEEEEEEVEEKGSEEKVRVQPVTSISRGRRRSKGVPLGTPTKHDPVICGRKNARNMEKFPLDFPCGDMGDGSEDFRLPNAVYNTLREHSHREGKQAQRLHEKKEHSTQEHVFDPKTRLLLFKLVDAGVLAEVNGCISTGKEASVYHATGGSSEDYDVADECALKVFKTTLNEFKTRDRYIKDDYRFKDRFGKQNPRKVVRLWAEKEMHNLKRLHDGGIPCPRVVLLRKHILIMEFIGEDQKPAPKLKDLAGKLSREQMNSAYQQCIQCMQRMYTTCRLVHSDLSEYNMLWHRGKVIFIDVSQSVEPSHPHGLEFLLRDCTNVSGFFSRCGVRDVMTAHQLFNFVSGMDIHAETEDTFLAQLRSHTQKEKLMQMMHSRQEQYPFDFFFEYSPRQQTASSSSDSDPDTNPSHRQ